MKMLILGLMIGASLVSCSKGGGGQYVGKWQNAGLNSGFLSITKSDSDDTFFVNFATPGERQDYTGILKDNKLLVTVPMLGTVPIVIDKGVLHFSNGYTCKDCSIYNKVN